jgi:hypothetical protein
MLPPTPFGAADYVAAIKKSGLTIYDPITPGDPKLWIPTPQLQQLLDRGLRGFSVAGMAGKTRSKLVRERICQILGYPTPRTFQDTRPRFPGQSFDSYVQTSDNLQVWNEELAAARRYVIIRASLAAAIDRVKIINGDALSLLSTTGTRTRKYQAICGALKGPTELAAPGDTEILRPLVSENPAQAQRSPSPADPPQAGQILAIRTLFGKLSGLIGRKFADPGYGQDRPRGDALHALVCQSLGYMNFADDGQFPDIKAQLLEVKLQSAQTIDIGGIRPDSTQALGVPLIDGKQIRHCDVRYAVFVCDIVDGSVTITNLVLTTGQAFFARFPEFKGRKYNDKLQIHLPANFFDI